MVLEEHQPQEQTGFRKNFATTDHLMTVNQLIEKSNEFQKDLHIAFIDFEKAFDSVEIPSTAAIKLDSIGKPFKITR